MENYPGKARIRVSSGLRVPLASRTGTASRWQAYLTTRSASAIAGTAKGRCSGSRRTNGTPLSAARATVNSTASAVSDPADTVSAGPAHDSCRSGQERRPSAAGGLSVFLCQDLSAYALNFYVLRHIFRSRVKVTSVSSGPMSLAGLVRLTSTDTEEGATHDRAEDRHPVRAGRRAPLRRPERRLGQHRAGPADHRVADGRRRVRHPGRALHRPHGGDLRPARGGAQPAYRRRPGDHAGRARRRPAPADLSRRWTRGRWTSSPAAAARSTRWPWWPGTRSRSGRWWPTSRPRSPNCPTARPRWPPATDIHETYQRSGFGPAMAKFIALISLAGPIPADFARPARARPRRLRAAGRGRRLAERPAAGPEHAVVPRLRARLRRAPRRAHPHRRRGRRGIRRRWPAGRAGTAVAARLGTAPVTFPGGHGGFLGGEYGGMGKPDAFAATLRTVLEQAAREPRPGSS